MEYSTLLARKLPRAQERGIAVQTADLLPSLFDYQAHCTEFALRVGSCGIYLDTGLGKTARSSWPSVMPSFGTAEQSVC